MKGNIIKKTKIILTPPSASIKHDFIKPGYSLFTQPEHSSFGEICSHACNGFRSETTVKLSDQAKDALSTDKLILVRNSSTELQISCSSISLNLKYCYPIDHIKVNITTLKDEKRVVITCICQAHNFLEESVCFMANPDHQLSIVPLKLSMNIIAAYSRGQFTCVETEGMKSATNTPLVKVKKTLQYLLESSRECSHFHLLSHGKETFLGYVLVNNVLFEYQRGTPALDLAFCFLDHHENSGAFQEMGRGSVPHRCSRYHKHIVDDSELELLQTPLNTL